MVYKVDDRTGPLVDVKKWLDDQKSEAELNLRVECRCVCVEGRCVCGGKVCVLCVCVPLHR